MVNPDELYVDDYEEWPEEEYSEPEEGYIKIIPSYDNYYWDEYAPD